jgi:hypothetical protein
LVDNGRTGSRYFNFGLCFGATGCASGGFCQPYPFLFSYALFVLLPPPLFVLPSPSVFFLSPAPVIFLLPTPLFVLPVPLFFFSPPPL